MFYLLYKKANIKYISNLTRLTKVTFKTHFFSGKKNKKSNTINAAVQCYKGKVS